MFAFRSREDIALGKVPQCTLSVRHATPPPPTPHPGSDLATNASDTPHCLSLTTTFLLCRVVVPSDLAIAFVLSRPLRRVRLPLELAAAEVLARAFPALTRVHVMALFRAIPGYKDPEELKMGMRMSRVCASLCSVCTCVAHKRLYLYSPLLSGGEKVAPTLRG